MQSATPIVGITPARVTRVRRQEIIASTKTLRMMEIALLTNIETFVLKPSYMTAVSLLMRLRTSPVFYVSKKPISL